MTKRITGLLLAVVMMLTMLPMASTLTASAESTTTYIDHVEALIDVPVDGVKLKSKDNLFVKMVSDYLRDYHFYYDDDDDCVIKSKSVAWRDADGNMLKDGTKAELGKTYSVTIIIELKKGYIFRGNMNDYVATINGATAIATEYGASGDGWTVLALDATYTAIASVPGTLTAYYDVMNLSPREGLPFEASVKAMNATNIRYQWYITYGDGFDTGWLEFGGAIELEDGRGYKGAQTANFKIHNGFDDTFYELFEGDFAIVCKVTSDNGEVITSPLRYTVIPREVVSNPTFSGLTVPVYGAKPDFTVVSGDSTKYIVNEVRWYGGKNANGNYTTRLYGNDTFEVGTYKCRLYVTPTDEYRFNDSSVATIDGGSATIITNSGWEDDPVGPDDYYIEREYAVASVPDEIANVSATVPVPFAGKTPNTDPAAVKLDVDTCTVTQVKWYVVEGSAQTAMTTATFEEGKSYACRLYLTAKDGYVFPSNYHNVVTTVNGINAGKISTSTTKQLVVSVIMTAVKPAFTLKPQSGAVVTGKTLNVKWATNFTPVKLVLSCHDATAEETRPTTLDPTATSASLKPTANDGSYYWLTAYYTDTQYITSDRFYVTDKSDHTVIIDGTTVKNGEFYDDDAAAVVKTPTDSSYAYYYDGILYLANFNDKYADIEFTIPDFEIRYVGDNQINSITEAVRNGVKQSLSLWGEGTLDLYGASDAGIWVEGDVIFGKGSVTMDDASSYAFYYVDSLTIENGGSVYIYCSQGGVFSNDATISVTDGSLQVFDGGTWQNTTFFNPTIADGYVYVSESSANSVPLEECEEWDGVELFGYDTVWIVSEPYSETETPVFTTQPVGGKVKAGEQLTVSWATNFTPVKLVLSYHNATAEETYPTNLDPTATSVALEATADDGSYYWISAYYSDTEYVASDRIYVTEETGLKGDINGDGKVNITDAVLLYYHVNGKTKLADESIGDMTGDGKVNIQDAVNLYYFVNGKISVL